MTPRWDPVTLCLTPPPSPPHRLTEDEMLVKFYTRLASAGVITVEDVTTLEGDTLTAGPAAR